MGWQNITSVKSQNLGDLNFALLYSADAQDAGISGQYPTSELDYFPATNFYGMASESTVTYNFKGEWYISISKASQTYGPFTVTTNLFGGTSSYTYSPGYSDRSHLIGFCLALLDDPENHRMKFRYISYRATYRPDLPCFVLMCSNCFGTDNAVTYAAAKLKLQKALPVIPPYQSNDYSESIGGHGNHDDTSDTIEDGVLPLATATMSGMCTVWVPDWGEIQSVANALLNPNIAQVLAGNIVKFSDVIIGLSVFPCSISATNTGTVTVNVLGIEVGTGVVCHIADSQYITIDCGTLNVNEYWGNCLDYNPYTRISIYLPFCGTYELDTDEVMGKTLGVTYRIDIFSGACLATIKIGGSIYYQYAGQCSAQIPISSVSFDNFLSSMLELGVATATGIGAVGAAGAATEAAGHAWTEAKTTRQALKASAEYDLAEENYTKVKERAGESIADAAVGAVMGSKGFYQHAGAMGGSPGFMGVRKPYLIIKRPEQVIPSMYGKFHGYPSNTTAVLNDLTGYTQVDDIRLNIPEATVDEIIECEQLLKGGIVI